MFRRHQKPWSEFHREDTPILLEELSRLWGVDPPHEVRLQEDTEKTPNAFVGHAQAIRAHGQTG